jgi:hypothetical protein
MECLDLLEDNEQGGSGAGSAHSDLIALGIFFPKS